MKNILLCLFLILLFTNACSQQSAEQNQARFDQQPPLITAAENGDLPTLRKLLDSNTQVDVKDACFWTPLMKAALNGHLDAAKRLIEAGADVNQVDKGGYSAMMLAASKNHAEIVDLLINNGAQINQVEATGGWSALIWSAKLGHIESVQALLSHHADRNIRDFDGFNAQDWAEKNQHQEIAQMLANISQ
jgi:ankyrin repeat protein